MENVMMTLQELLEHAAESAQKLFAQQGEVHPMWLAMAHDGQMHVLLTPWKNDDEKYTIVSKLKAFFQDKNIKQYAFMSETWILEMKDTKNDPDAQKFMRGELKPSQHKDRKEAVMIIAEDDSSACSQIFYIDRSEGKPPVLRKADRLPDGFSGRMSGLLQREKPKNTTIH